MRKFFSKKTLALGGGALLALLALLLPQPAHAWSLFGIGNILGSAVAWIVFVVAYLASTIAGFFIAIMVYGIGIILQLNTNVVNSPAVQIGFQVTLSIANLGFVLGVIVIAIATIIRYESYGMKKLLRNLIVAALLVNFSLVIAGSIVNFSDRLSATFLVAFPGGGGGENAGSKFNNFASAFGGAFTPQRTLLSQTIGLADNTTGADDMKNIGGAGGAASTLSSIISPLIGLIFAVAMLLVILITIATFFYMLLVRYIYLGMLLILMPLVWLLWIFPLSEHLWKKWWDKFLKWTFFAPISLFFLWLVIITSEVMNKAAGTNPTLGLKGLGYTPDDTAFSGLSGFVGNLASQTIGTFLQGAVLIGLALGGLIAAEKFSIVGAKTAMGAVKGMGNWGTRRLKQGGGLALQKSGLGKLGSKLMTGKWGEGSSNRVVRGLHTLAKYSGLKLAGQKAGEGLQQLEVGATGKLVAEEAGILKKETAGMTTAQKANLYPSANSARKVALGEMAAEDPKLAAELAAKGFGPADKATFKRYGKEDTWDDVDKGSKFMGSEGHYWRTINKELAEKKESIETQARQEASVSPEELVEAEKPFDEVRREAYEKARGAGKEESEAREAGNDAVKEHIDLRAKKDKYEAAKERIAEEIAEKVLAEEIDPETGKVILDENKQPKKVPAMEKIREIEAEKIKDVKKGDKVAYEKVFGGKEAFGLSKESVKMMAGIFAEKMAYANQQLVPQVVAKLNAKQLQGFGKLMDKTYDNAIAATSGTTQGDMRKGKDNLKSILARHMTGHTAEKGAHVEEHPPAAHPPATAEPPTPEPPASGGGTPPTH